MFLVCWVENNITTGNYDEWQWEMCADEVSARSKYSEVVARLDVREAYITKVLHGGTLFR
jgi:hypothetical protein